MRRDDIRAPNLAQLDLYCDRVACAVGRLSVRIFGMNDDDGRRAGASSRPRAATHQYPARHRRGRRHWPPLSAARSLAAGRHRRHRAGVRRVESAPRHGLRFRRRPRARSFRQGRRDHGALPAPRRAGAEDHGRSLPRDARRAWWRAAGRCRATACTSPNRICYGSRCGMPSSDAGTVHIIGAGLAGLAAAVRLERLAPRHRHPRGDRAARRPLPLVSRPGHRHADRQRHASGAVGQSRRAVVCAGRSAPSPDLQGPAEAEFPFVDLASRRALDAALQRRPDSLVDLRQGPARAGDRRRRLSAAGAAGLDRARQADRRGDRIAPARSTSACIEPLSARRAEHRAARGIGEARRRADPRDVRAGRQGLPAAAGARRHRRTCLSSRRFATCSARGVFDRVAG